MQKIVRNVKQFSFQKLKVLEGKVPLQINGRYFRNGPGKLQYGNNIIRHWFMGSGAILKVQIKNGQCWSEFKYLQTPLHKIQQAKQNFNNKSLLSIIMKAVISKESRYDFVPFNTSVLPLKGMDSNILLALSEGGPSLKVNKDNLKTLNIENFGFINNSYSAHYKIDPDNGDIYNVGTQNGTSLILIKCTSNMKHIKSSTVKLRGLQGIHDFCLAGDYIVIFQAPLKVDFLGLFKYFKVYDSEYYDPKLRTIVHIYKKSDFSLVKKIQTEPFYSFHFSNGFSNDKQIVLEYVKYEGENANKILDYVRQYPKHINGTAKKINFQSVLEQMRINLKDFSIQTTKQPILGEFPVCNDNSVGKPWKCTYLVIKQDPNILLHNVLGKYDRETKELKTINFGKNSAVSEPVLIANEKNPNKNSYLMSVITEGQQSYLDILNAQTIQSICRLQMPQVIPYGFHGKWDETTI